MNATRTSGRFTPNDHTAAFTTVIQTDEMANCTALVTAAAVMVSD
jgi:hypothetical protein